MKDLVLQIFKFIGFSGIGWILDFGIYTGLKNFSDNIITNNIISSWIGVSFVFIFTTRKIFKNNNKIALEYKYFIYIGYQIILIFFVSELLGKINYFLLNNIKIELIVNFSTALSKIIVTPITMILNFIVMKNVIEKM